METEIGKFIAVFVMVILPIVFMLWAIGRRFEGHDEEIMELKNRINKIHEEQQHADNEKFYCEFRGYDVTYRKTCRNCIVGSGDEDGNFYCPYYKK